MKENNSENSGHYVVASRTPIGDRLQRRRSCQFSTNENPEKCKTKCIAFLACARPLRKFKLCGDPLPWVKHSKHLGNTIENKINGMKIDTIQKPARYIEKNIELIHRLPY